MCGIFAVTTAELQSWRILDAVCVKGRLDVAQWITNYFNLTDTGLYDDHGIRRTTMYATCVNGHLSTAQWLVNYFGASIAHGSPRYYALRYICENGDLPMAHWFAVQFGITRFEAFRDCAMPLVNACYGNHLMVARWFVWFFEPTSQDLHEVMGLTDILEAICHSDNLAMMKWFVEHFRITEADIRVGGDYVMHCAHTRSCGAIARYLMERFGQVVIDDARVDRLRVEFAAMEYLESQRAKF
jgi:hypothetical protein